MKKIDDIPKKISPIILMEKKLYSINLISKLLTKIDKKGYIEIQSQKLWIVIEGILAKQSDLETIYHILNTIFSSMEPSLVPVI